MGGGSAPQPVTVGSRWLVANGDLMQMNGNCGLAVKHPRRIHVVRSIQIGYKPPAPYGYGMVDMTTANSLLDCCLYDFYKDEPMTYPPNVLYKVYIPVHANRSIETNGTLYAVSHGGKVLTPLYTWKTHTHGQNDPVTGAPLNCLADDGATPTGLMTFDLNSPETDPVSFGPYPVNRAVQGLKGNAFVISNIRDGILMHTGEWPDWNPSKEMPNSHGCIHCHPNAIKTIWHILTEQLGVIVHNNTFGKLPYPYIPQGILSIEQID